MRRIDKILLVSTTAAAVVYIFFPPASLPPGHGVIIGNIWAAVGALICYRASK